MAIISFSLKDTIINKTKIWAKLHPLVEGATMANLGDYNLVSNDDMVVDALKEGLRNAQRMLRTLKMGISPHAKNKKWFIHPWDMEKVEAKHLLTNLLRSQHHVRMGTLRC